MSEFFGNMLFLFFFAAYVDLNCGWFVSNLVFERSVIVWSIRDGSGSNIHDDNNGENKKVKSEYERESKYYSDEKLLWRWYMYVVMQVFFHRYY